jgi:hypothetical protein
LHHEHKKRFVILGSAEAEDVEGQRVQAQLLELMKKHPDQVKVIMRFDEKMASRIYAGSDIFVMPSRTEPGGIANQLANKYGTQVIAPEVGGLIDFFHQWGGVGYHLPKINKGEEDLAIASMITAINNKSSEFWYHRQIWNINMQLATKFRAGWERRVALYESNVYEKAILIRRDEVAAAAQSANGASGFFAWLAERLFGVRTPDAVGRLEGAAQSLVGVAAVLLHMTMPFLLGSIVALFALHYFTGVVVWGREDPVKYDVRLSLAATAKALSGFAGWPLIAAGLATPGLVGLPLFLAGIWLGPRLHYLANSQNDELAYLRAA